MVAALDLVMPISILQPPLDRVGFESDFADVFSLSVSFFMSFTLSDWWIDDVSSLKRCADVE